MWPRFSLLLTSLGLTLALSAPAKGQEAGTPEGFRYTRIHEDTAGTSRFSDEALRLQLIDPGRAIQPTPASSPWPVEGMRVFCPPASGRVDWHPVPARLVNVILSGEVEIEVGAGETRRFGPGSVILGEDTNGPGHRTRVVDPDGACFAMLPLAGSGADDEPGGVPGPAGTLAPDGPPVGAPERVDAGGLCVVDLRQPYTIRGALSGRLVIDYRILVDGPCGLAPGTVREEWIAHGTFDGSAGDGPVTATLSYTARVAAGGRVEGLMRLRGGVEAALRVEGRFADGELAYTLLPARDPAPR
jgi:hypothetical protein